MRKPKADKLGVVVGTREIGPYSFEFILRDDKRHIQLWEDHDTMLWESPPFGPNDDKTFRKRIQVGLAVLASRLSVLHEKTLIKIHELAA